MFQLSERRSTKQDEMSMPGPTPEYPGHAINHKYSSGEMLDMFAGFAADTKSEASLTMRRRHQRLMPEVGGNVYKAQRCT